MAKDFMTSDYRLSSQLADVPLEEILSNYTSARKTLTSFSSKRAHQQITHTGNSDHAPRTKKPKTSLVERKFDKHAPTEEPIYSKPKSYKYEATRKAQKQQSKVSLSRDPRFDDLSGTFNEEFFDENYKFLSEIKEQELKELQKQQKKAKTDDEKQHISRLVQKFKEEKRSRNKREVTREIVSKNLDEQIAQLEDGKKPFYLKKNKLKELVKEALVKKGLERESKKRLKNRATKSAQKSRKHFPGRR
ncbi:ribosomal RNA processing protein 36 homolog [Symsagittifera roscoffensis]|uniref:ribosomal RNA processing protein 36 homolog n=1 Tax=Symsagittifera roscoffensis TaxID=84072 RepID=UPI00307C4E66